MRLAISSSRDDLAFGRRNLAIGLDPARRTTHVRSHPITGHLSTGIAGRKAALW